jgi:Na+/proline symporter
LAGVAGAIVMAMVLWSDGHFGPGDAERTVERWPIALGLHVLAGAGFGLIYSYLFDALDRAGWRVGITVGSVHGFVAVALVSLAPSRHALYQLGEPSGWGVILIVGLHVVFGAVVGALYETKAPIHERETTRAELEPETGSPGA